MPPRRVDLPSTEQHDDGLADVADRLTAEFDGAFGLCAVSGVVRQAARDLAGTGAGAWHELLERCARQRLRDLLQTGPPPSEPQADVEQDTAVSWFPAVPDPDADGTPASSGR